MPHGCAVQLAVLVRAGRIGAWWLQLGSEATSYMPLVRRASAGLPLGNFVPHRCAVRLAGLVRAGRKGAWWLQMRIGVGNSWSSVGGEIRGPDPKFPTLFRIPVISSLCLNLSKTTGTQAAAPTPRWKRGRK